MERSTFDWLVLTIILLVLIILFQWAYQSVLKEKISFLNAEKCTLLDEISNYQSLKTSALLAILNLKRKHNKLLERFTLYIKDQEGWNDGHLELWFSAQDIDPKKENYDEFNLDITKK